MGFRATDGPHVRMFKKRVTLSLPPMVYDLIVIGGGPAGLTAGVYARTRNLSTLVLEAEQAGGQLPLLLPQQALYGFSSLIPGGGVGPRRPLRRHRTGGGGGEPGGGAGVG